MVDDATDDPTGEPAERRRAAADVRPSTVTLPEQPPEGVRTILDFFLLRFPKIARHTWVERFAAGKVWASGETIDAGTAYRPLLEVRYRREVEAEPPVRGDFRVVWSDQHLMVVDKPPDLPVTPGGRWVRGCLLHLLLEATGNDRIAPLHRLDRLTSGLVLLSLDPATRPHYARLFQPRPLADKVYTAVCEVRRDPTDTSLVLAHHIARDPQAHWRQAVRPELPPNARCEVELLAVEGGLALARVRPLTGRKHQIRVQLAAAGLPVLGDPLYGGAPCEATDEAPQRMWLDAYRLEVRGFPRPDGGELTASWTSSRQPAELFRRAVRRDRQGQDMRARTRDTLEVS